MAEISCEKFLSFYVYTHIRTYACVCVRARAHFTYMYVQKTFITKR